MKQKSIKKNAILNMIASVAGTACSLIALPYVTRVLQPENYGKITYVRSVVAYFGLLAELGILSYAMRECAGVRDDKRKFQKIANEVFSINMIATISAVIFLQLFLLFVPSFQQYWLLAEIFILGVVFETLRVRWIYQAYEEYSYLSLQGLGSCIILLISTFLLIKDENDYVRYAVLLILPAVIPGIMNIVRSRKYCRLKIILQCNLKQHLSPVLLIFAAQVSNTIYVGSDTVILGYLSSNYAVGLYGVSVRIYETVKTLLAAALSVTIPRFCYFYNNSDKEKCNELLSKVATIIVILCVPSLIGLLILSKEVICVLFGYSYLKGKLALQLLSITLVFAMPSILLSQCILIPMKKENVIFKTTAFGAVLNVILNIVFIPKYAQNAAAFTTLVSEMIVLFIYLFKTKKEWYGIIKMKVVGQVILAGGVMGLLVLYIKFKIENLVLSVVAGVVAGIISYFGMLILMKNSVVYEYLGLLLSMLKKYRK